MKKIYIGISLLLSIVIIFYSFLQVSSPQDELWETILIPWEISTLKTTWTKTLTWDEGDDNTAWVIVINKDGTESIERDTNSDIKDIKIIEVVWDEGDDATAWEIVENDDGTMSIERKISSDSNDVQIIEVVWDESDDATAWEVVENDDGTMSIIFKE
jgi:hypothetical protein